MTLSEWINNIRWKYFTNEKAGLIFKELTKEFRMVEQMTENKRYNIKPSKIIEDGFCIQDDEKEHSFPTTDDKSHLIMYEKALNEQEETIQELYDFRLIYNALLFNEWSKHDTIEVYKSKKHSDGELCFDGEWFVVVAILPTGQITNHYHIKYWDYFKIKEYSKVKDEFDEHTSIDVLKRLKSMVMCE